MLTVYAMSSGPVLAADQDSRSGGQLAGSLGLSLEGMLHPRAYLWGETLLVIAPEHVDTLAGDGYGKEEIRARIQEVTAKPIRELVEDDRSAVGFKRAVAERMDDEALDRKVSKFRSGSDIHIVVAGSEAGSFSAAFHGWLSGETGSMPVSKKILQ